MPANDGKQQSGAGTQPGGVNTKVGSSAVPNYPKKSKDGKGIPTPTFPSGNTAK